MKGLQALAGDLIYLDPNVFIYAIEAFTKYAGVCRQVLLSMEQEKVRIVTSELTLSEVLVRPLRKDQQDIVAAYEKFLVTGSSLTVEAVSRSILRDAAVVRASMNCRLPDAIHVATAMQANADAMLTADRTIKTPPSIRRVTLDSLIAESETE